MISSDKFFELISAILLGVVVLVAAISFFSNFVSSAASDDAPVSIDSSDRFYIPANTTASTTIIVDRVTGVCYLWHRNVNIHAGGLTVLVDADGKPVIWTEGESID